MLFGFVGPRWPSRILQGILTDDIIEKGSTLRLRSTDTTHLPTKKGKKGKNSATLRFDSSLIDFAFLGSAVDSLKRRPLNVLHFGI
jgi:hypothetical protein